MHFTSTVVSTLALAGAALAQDYGSGSGSGSGYGAAGAAGASMTASAAEATATMGMGMGGEMGMGGNMQVIQVGGAGGALTFTPNDVTAMPGTQIQFQFNPKNHSVVQSNFANPCIPISESMPGTAGFFSGFMPVKETDSQKPTFTLTVNDTKPVWVYCAQGPHCQKGMVMAINAPKEGDKTLAAFTKLAAQAPMNKSPGGMGAMGTMGTNGTATGSAGSAGASGSAGGDAGASGAAGGAVSTGTTTAPIAVATGAAAAVRGGSALALGGALAAFVALA